jgi:hypothetical protein
MRHRLQPRTAIVAASAIAIALLACSGRETTKPTFDGTIGVGTWGGDSAGLIVTESATHLHIACTYGDVEGLIAVGADGRFDVTGSYVLRAYPVAVGPSLPARFIGKLEGATATITVIVDDTVEHKSVTRGPVIVTFGDAPRVGPCPICTNKNMRSAISRD